MQKRNRSQSGEVVVEATIILPIAILCVILLLYISIFICQKAMLQAALETSVVYFKNTLTDNFVEQSDTLALSSEEDVVRAVGNQYTTPEPLNPYDKFSVFNKKVSDDGFGDYFDSVAGNLLFRDDLNDDPNDDLKLTIDYSNYILFKEISVTARQQLSFPIDFSIIGVDGTVDLSATAQVAVVDHDELIRNIDFAADAIRDTKIGDAVKKLKSNVTGLYGKLKEKLK